MSIRLFACVLMLGATSAYAAPPHKTPKAATNVPGAPEDIDVDAMARAKDVGAQPPAPAAADAAADASATPNSDADTSAAAPPTAQAQAPAEPATDAAPAPTAQDAIGQPPSPLASTPAAGSAEGRLADACEARAKSLLDAAQQGDYAAAMQDFDAKMRSGLPQPKFRQAWESLAQFGALTARGQPHPALSEGYIAVTIPLIFEKANLYAQVTCGSDGRIAGFYVKPLDVPAR